MDDLEITRRCAEAMGWMHADGWFPAEYDPLHDDAQCMALIKRFDMELRNESQWGFGVQMWVKVAAIPYKSTAESPDLNRAVCTAVAQMEVKRG